MSGEEYYEKKVVGAVDGLMALLAELLAERLVAEHHAQKKKSANP